MRKFQDDLLGLIAEVEMRLVSNNLQDKMKEDLTALKNMEKEVIVPSDKTSNFYTMNVKEYQQHLDKEVMKVYKKVDIKKAMDIDNEASNLANTLNLSDRIEGMAIKKSFMTLKDHKEDFPGKLSFRLINPTNDR